MVVPYIGAQSSGPTYSVQGLCKGLYSNGVSVQLHALEPLPIQVRAYAGHGYAWRAFPFRPLGRSPEMLRALCERALVSDIMHSNSLWMLPNIYPALAVRNRTCKLVTAPRGAMTEYSWERSHWKKRLMMVFGQRFALGRTNMFHATCESEIADIRRFGWKQPVALVPNGVEIPSKIKASRHEGERSRRLLYLSRIHPEKRLDLLLKAWRRLQDVCPDWELWVCGPLEGEYPRKMVELGRTLGLQRVTFKGEVLGSEKEAAYQSSDLFVLPTNTENFGIVVAESLANGTPVIVSKGAPWSGLEPRRCGWWVDNDEEAFAAALRYAMRLPPAELEEMGRRGRLWMGKDFSWDALAQSMLSAYEWLLRGGTKPDVVFT